MPSSVPLILLLALVVVVLGDGALIVERVARYFSTPQVHAEDQSALSLPPPPPTRPLVEELSRLGFTRLGEAGLPSEAARRGPVQVWYFIDRDRTTVGGVFAIRGILGHAMVYSWFGDEAVMVTGHRRGEEVEEPNFRYRVVQGTLSDAYRQHLAQIPDFSIRFGKPRRLDNMAEVLRLDTIYNQKFARRRLRRVMVQSISRPLFLLYVVLVLLGVYAASTWTRLPPLAILGAAGVLVAAGAATYWLVRKFR